MTEEYPAALPKCFKKLGFLIGSYPWVCLGISLFIVLPISVYGLFNLRLQDDIRTGYTVKSADSIRANAVYREYYNITSDPYGFVIVVEAKDGKSMFRQTHFEAAARLLEFLYRNFTVSTPEYGDFNYEKVCGTQCELNAMLPILQKLFTLHRKGFSVKKLLPMDTIDELNWPVATVFGRNVSLHYNLAGVTTMSSANSTFSNIATVKYFIVWMLGDRGKSESEKMLLSKWESALFKKSHEPTFDRYLRFHVFSDGTANIEVMRAGMRGLVYFVAGAALMATFIQLSILISATYNKETTATLKRLPIIATAALFSPLMGVTTALSAMHLLNGSVNTLMLSATPFLVVGVGVDDAFLLIHAWYQCNANERSDSRLATALQSVGPSITITSLTNALGFLIGATVPIPQLSQFSLNTAVAILVDYLLQTFFFAPVLLLTLGKAKSGLQLEDSVEMETLSPLGSSVVEAAGEKSVSKERRLQLVSKPICDRTSSYCKFLVTPLARVLAVLTLVGLLSSSILGVRNMAIDFSPEKTISTESTFATTVMPAIGMWYEHAYGLLFIVKRPPDICNPTSNNHFMGMVDKLEQLPSSLGPAYSVVWLREYKHYVDNLKKQNVFANWLDISLNSSGFIEKGYHYLPDFAQDYRYKMWTEQNLFKYRRSNGTIELNSMVFITHYTGMAKWAARADVLYAVRSILLSYYSEFNVTVWDYNGPLLDLVVSIPRITKTAVMISMGCMAAISALFIPSLLQIVCAIVMISSICFNLVGALSWWGCDHDPIMMLIIIMAIGFSVDYTAHISYCFHRHKREAPQLQSVDWLRSTFDEVVWAMFQAGTSSILVVMPLFAIDAYLFRTFAKSVLLLVLIGWSHGLFILPVLLTSLSHLSSQKIPYLF